MIARTWHGAVPAEKAEAYHRYLLETGVHDCEATPGNRGVYSSPWDKSTRSRARVLRGGPKARGRGDAVSSLTTSNAGATRNPRAPEGLRRRGAVYRVAAPRRWLGIACVAAPCIRPHGARNAATWTCPTGCSVLRRIVGSTAHFLFLSLWESLASIEAFAGEEIERARYYPEDEAFLLELEPTVTHYEVLERPSS